MSSPQNSPTKNAPTHPSQTQADKQTERQIAAEIDEYLYVRDEHVTHIPTANTRLIPHMRVTAMISPGADNSLLALREGCEARE